jgi:hypothetical protein
MLRAVIRCVSAAIKNYNRSAATATATATDNVCLSAVLSMSALRLLLINGLLTQKRGLCPRFFYFYSKYYTTKRG